MLHQQRFQVVLVKSHSRNRSSFVRSLLWIELRFPLQCQNHWLLNHIVKDWFVVHLKTKLGLKESKVIFNWEFVVIFHSRKFRFSSFWIFWSCLTFENASGCLPFENFWGYFNSPTRINVGNQPPPIPSYSMGKRKLIRFKNVKHILTNYLIF